MVDLELVTINFDEGLPYDISNIKRLTGVIGLYFIFNKDVNINYPFGASRLLYIGMSEKRTNSIGKRLQDHLEGVSGNIGIVSYKKVNPVMFTYLNIEALRGVWSSNVESLEAYFINDFVERYGVYPICNNKSGFTKDGTDVRDLHISWEVFEK